MNPVKAILGNLYHLGLKVDRKLTQVNTLPAKVISVGNIAVGGRAKTPFVIYLCRGLQARGYEPIVLSRGYGRRSSERVFLSSVERFAFDADICGDEALEIWSKTRVPVVVGARRAQNALEYIEVAKPDLSKTVFVLDDGFQHWSLKRDLDIVLVHTEDFHSRLLPIGRLREPVGSLDRAQIVLELGRDVHKIPSLRSLEQASKVEPALLLTTRAPDKGYEAILSGFFQHIRIAALADHASRARLMRELTGASESQVVVGAKEAVKIFGDLAQLEQFFKTGCESIVVAGRKIQLFYIGLELKIEQEESLWSRIVRKLRES